MGKMEKTEYKKSFVYLFFGGVEFAPLLENSILSLRRAGFDGGIRVYVDKRSSALVQAICDGHLAEVKIYDSTNIEGIANNYVEIGSTNFNLVTLFKWNAILDSLADGLDYVVFSDCDISYINNPVHYLEDTLNYYPILIQSEGEAIFPPSFCTGFMAWSSRSSNLLSQIQRIHIERVSTMNDQDCFNFIVRQHKDLLIQTFLLPEGLFVNGLNYRTILNPRTTFPVVRNPSPLMFHANYVKGLKAKVDLLKFVNLWFL
jgi:hypothetical protein